VWRCVEALASSERFAVDASDTLYLYRAGVYGDRAHRSLGQRITALLDGWKLPGLWTSQLVTEAANRLAIDAPELEERPRWGVLNVRNGLLDWPTRVLRPHDPDYRTTIQLPIRYDPQATCPAWERFVGEVWPADCVAAGVPWQLAALLLCPTKSVQQAVLLTGEGANGKSTMLRAYRALLGRQNTAGISLHRLEADRFAAARLQGKLANICPDLPSEHLASTSVFKALTDGDDSVHAEVKYGRQWDLYPFCRLVFSANHLPRSNDSSHAFFRRWLVLPFERQFEPGVAGTRPRETLDAELADPHELSGVLNRALDVLSAVQVRGIAETPSMRAAWLEFRATTDPVAIWLDAETRDDPAASTPCRLVRVAYQQACRREGRPVPSDTAFGLAVKRLRPKLALTRHVIGNRQEWHYDGLALAQPVAQPVSP
jgi:putative DNA primase/helicase